MLSLIEAAHFRNGKFLYNSLLGGYFQRIKQAVLNIGHAHENAAAVRKYLSVNRIEYHAQRNCAVFSVVKM